MGKNSPAKSVTEKSQVINISSPKAMSQFAIELKKFVVDNNLYSAIGEKNFVHVEGWQFAGASMGLFPIIEKVEDISPKDKTFKYDTKYQKSIETPVFKYRAEVKIVNLKTGETVGYGVAICSNEEQKKKTFDEFAVASMAQTRAVGKAFRLSLGWVMKLAGYEATTAEEVDETVDEDAGAITMTSDIPADDVRVLVELRLNRMEAPAKVKFLRDTIGTVTDRKLDERQHRALYAAMIAEAKKDES